MLLLAVGAVLAGCGIRDTGLGERCADLMREAYPGGGIKVTGIGAQSEMTSGIARVDGIREKLAPGAGAVRDVAVECRFDNGILISFRWIAGPLQ